MFDIKPIIAKIQNLVEEDSDASVTYAALEARLALEKVCYDRLRQRHDYISHSELKEWQPGALIKRLLRDVDPRIEQTKVLSMSASPVVEGLMPPDEDYVEIGTEVGFNSKRISSLWHALSKLALHIRLPENREDRISSYGEKDAIKAKVQDTLKELERLSMGTMTFSGFGEEVSFECLCGARIRRKSDLLRHGQHVHCIDPNCKVAWRASKDGQEFSFEQITIPITCKGCATVLEIPWLWFFDMKYEDHGILRCHKCKTENYVQWRLCTVEPAVPLTQK